MSTYDDYTDLFLAALYLETEDTGRDFHSARYIHQKYGFSPGKPHWVSRMADEGEHLYFKNVSKTIGNYEAWSFRLSPEGYRKVEESLGDTDGIRRFLAAPLSRPDGDSMATIRDTVEAEVVPASNRLVRLDHNLPEYKTIARGLEELYEQVRQDNEVGETVYERDRLLRSLGAAKELWCAAELYVIQIRVGVAMAVEDAANALRKAGKVVAAGLLVDMIKQFVKNATGIDF